MSATVDVNILPVPPVAIGFGLGICSHLLYFIRGEHHKQAVRLAQTTFALPCLLIGAFVRVGELSLREASAVSVILTAGFFAGLFSSMLIYRVLFHRLGRFPGPFGARLSKFWHIAQLGKYDNYKRLDKWHDQYGEYVRIGPSELSIVDPGAVDAIMGARSSCTKAPWYDIADPLVSMHQCRDRSLHDKRRRTWDRGFSVKGKWNRERDGSSNHALVYLLMKPSS
jgi:hypothetical protein